MGVSQFDTFSVSWIATYENPFNLEAQFIVECYEDICTSGLPEVVSASNLKSVAQLSVKKGNPYLYHPDWRMALVVGENNMHDLIRTIVIDSMHLSLEEADTVIDRIDESLEEGLGICSDPRLN